MLGSIRKLLLCLALLSAFSCSFFDVKKTSSEAILKEELKTFNWNEVDVFPSFSACDQESDEYLKKVCFQETLTRNIQQSLSVLEIEVTEDINDTIELKFLISETGEISISQFEMDPLTRSEIPLLEDHIQASLESLPTLHPAIKRGQQVRTEFTMPILIQMN